MCYSARVEQDVSLLAARFSAAPIRAGWDLYTTLRQRSSGTPAPPLESRIYPGYFAPVVAKQDGQNVIHLMRYSVEPPEFVSAPQRYTSYNARRDNLTSPFWSESFRKHHGLIVLKGFFEWVTVKDLVQAGVVSLDSIKAAFAAQQAERRAKLAAAGKPFRPTKAELTDPLFRRIVIEFSADEAKPLLAPIIYSCRPTHDGSDLIHMGFAIVTDTPPPEVARAGHDRCPIFLGFEAAEAWLDADARLSSESLDRLLDQKANLTLQHRLAEAA